MKTFNQFLDEGVLTSIGRKKPEKKAQKAMDAGARARRKVARRVHAKYVSGSEDNVPDDIREGIIDTVKKGAKRHAKAVEKKKIKNRKAVPYAALAAQHEPEGDLVESDVHSGQGEKIQKRTKKWMDKKGMEGAPGLDAMKARTAEHKAKRGVKEDWKPEIEHSKLGDAKKKADKKRESKLPPHLQGDAIGKMKKAFATEEDKAFNYVVAKLKKQHGDGVLTKRDKIKPQSAAEKAKVRAHQAKVDKENAAERAKDPSQGRYPKG